MGVPKRSLNGSLSGEGKKRPVAVTSSFGGQGWHRESAEALISAEALKIFKPESPKMPRKRKPCRPVEP